MALSEETTSCSLIEILAASGEQGFFADNLELGVTYTTCHIKIFMTISNVRCHNGSFFGFRVLAATPTCSKVALSLTHTHSLKCFDKSDGWRTSLILDEHSFQIC